MMDSEVNYSCFVGVQTAAFRIGGCQRVGDQQLRGESGAVIAVAGAGNKRPLPLSLYSSSAGGQSAQSPRTRRQVAAVPARFVPWWQLVQPPLTKNIWFSHVQFFLFCRLWISSTDLMFPTTKEAATAAAAALSLSLTHNSLVSALTPPTQQQQQQQQQQQSSLEF